MLFQQICHFMPGEYAPRSTAHASARHKPDACHWMRTISLIFLLWMTNAANTLAQSPAPLQVPNLRLTTDGYVYAIVKQPDGGIVFGGNFAYVNGVPRRNLARLLPNGFLDPNWNPAPNGLVRALATDASGTAVFVGGAFWQIDGKMRDRIAKVAGNNVGAADANWNPGADDQVMALAVDASGAVYAGGLFNTIGGQQRARIAKLSGNGAGVVDAQWNPSANNEVTALALNLNGAIYVGGRFSEIGGTSRNRIAKLSDSGAGVADSVWNPSANNAVQSLAVDPSGMVYVGGAFTQIGGQTRRYIAKLAGTAAGIADPVWNPDFQTVALPNIGVYALALDSTGAVYAGGSFGNVGALPRNYLAKLSGVGSGAVDPNWNPSANGYVSALALNESGEVYAGGFFSQIGSETRASFAHLNPLGDPLLPIDAEQAGSVSALALLPDGGLIVGGRFERVDGRPHPNLLRLRADRSLDIDWNLNPTGAVDALVAAADGSLFVGGEFSQIGNLSRNRIAKVSADGTVHPSWSVAVNGPVRVLALDNAGALYVGGAYSQIGGLSRNRLAKITGSGAAVVDPTWNPSVNNTLYALAVDNNGALYASGDFSSIGGQNRNYLAKLSSSGTGAADTVWNPSPDYRVHALAVDSSGAVYAGGGFSEISGQTRRRIAKLSGSGAGDVDVTWVSPWLDDIYALALDEEGTVYAGGRNEINKLLAATGAADPEWNPVVAGSFVNGVQTLAADDSGVVYAGGDFTQISGQLRIGLAALPAFVPSDEARLSSLTPTTGTLSGAFNPTQFTYTLAVSNAIASIAFTPVAMDEGATITINGQTVASATQSPTLPLHLGSNPVSIQVTAEDGISQQEYLVDVIRLSSAPVALAIKIQRLPIGLSNEGNEIRQYRITTTNLGVQTASSVQLIAANPSGLSAVVWSCTAPSGCAPTQGTNALATHFDLAPGQSAIVELSGEVNPGAAFVDIAARASTASAGGNTAQVSINEQANDIGVMKSGFED